MPSILVVLPSSEIISEDKAFRQAIFRAQKQGYTVDITSFESPELSGSVLNNDVTVLVPRSAYLFPECLIELASHIEGAGGFSLAYADEMNNELPDFSPQRLLSQNYIQGPVAVRKSAINASTFAVQNLSPVVSVYKLLLELSRSSSRICHIPKVLSRLNNGSSLELSQDEISESRKVLEEERQQRGGGIVGEYIGKSAFLSRGEISGDPLISIVIPTRGKSHVADGSRQSFIVNAVRSIVAKTEYSNYEFVVVMDSGAENAVIQDLHSLVDQRLRIVEWDKPFNFSQKMNFGVMHARGDYILLLNDDVEVISPQWLSALLELAQLPNAGMSGAKLYYGDNTIQHAGHAYYGGSPTHIGLGLPRDSDGPQMAYRVTREVSGVTAACALMPKAVFYEVGGFTPLLPGNFNDVDLCLKVGWKNFDIYWTPEAELYHYESKTRDAHVHYYELDTIEHRWGLRLDDSRYWRGHPWAAG